MRSPLYSLPLLSVAVLTGGGLAACQGGPSAQAGVGQRPDQLELRDCDLLFQLGEEGSAITDVTMGVDDLPIEHVGIFVSGRGLREAGHAMPAAAAGTQSPGYVLEAIPDSGVTLTPLDTFLARHVNADDLPLVIVGRVVQSDFDPMQSLGLAVHYIGTPYDSLYMPDDREIYCSELVQKSYVNRLGRPVFDPIPMSFRDATGAITEHWERFYTRLGLVVPDGEPGSNPGELSRRDSVQIIARMF